MQPTSQPQPSVSVLPLVPASTVYLARPKGDEIVAALPVGSQPIRPSHPILVVPLHFHHVGHRVGRPMVVRAEGHRPARRLLPFPVIATLLQLSTQQTLRPLPCRAGGGGLPRGFQGAGIVPPPLPGVPSKIAHQVCVTPLRIGDCHDAHLDAGKTGLPGEAEQPAPDQRRAESMRKVKLRKTTLIGEIQIRTVSGSQVIF